LPVLSKARPPAARHDDDPLHPRPTQPAAGSYGNARKARLTAAVHGNEHIEVASGINEEEQRGSQRRTNGWQGCGLRAM
jgi:hypothetical protein